MLRKDSVTLNKYITPFLKVSRINAIFIFFICKKESRREYNLITWKSFLGRSGFTEEEVKEIVSLFTHAKYAVAKIENYKPD